MELFEKCKNLTLFSVFFSRGLVLIPPGCFLSNEKFKTNNLNTAAT